MALNRIQPGFQHVFPFSNMFLSFAVCLSVCLSTYLSISIYISLSLSLSLSISFPFVDPSLVWSLGTIGSTLILKGLWYPESKFWWGAKNKPLLKPFVSTMENQVRLFRFIWSLEQTATDHSETCAALAVALHILWLSCTVHQATGMFWPAELCIGVVHGCNLTKSQPGSKSNVAKQNTC